MDESEKKLLLRIAWALSVPFGLAFCYGVYCNVENDATTRFLLFSLVLVFVLIPVIGFIRSWGPIIPVFTAHLALGGYYAVLISGEILKLEGVLQYLVAAAVFLLAQLNGFFMGHVADRQLSFREDLMRRPSK